MIRADPGIFHELSLWGTAGAKTKIRDLFVCSNLEAICRELSCSDRIVTRGGSVIGWTNPAVSNPPGKTIGIKPSSREFHWKVWEPGTPWRRRRWVVWVTHCNLHSSIPKAATYGWWGEGSLTAHHEPPTILQSPPPHPIPPAAFPIGMTHPTDLSIYWEEQLINAPSENGEHKHSSTPRKIGLLTQKQLPHTKIA